MNSKGCLTCGFANPPEMAFCGSCGAPLGGGCPECGFENPPDFRFCGSCGARMPPTGGGPKPEPNETSYESIAPERRQISVLFCDLVGSTQLSQRLDPEDLREIVLAYQDVCAEIIERYDGHIAQYLGDGLLAYFGYPRAHEDDARRAVHVGLEMMEAIEGLSGRFEPGTGFKLEARVGIHTGDVVIGEVGGGGTREHLALGSTPNLAARLQGVANPGSVVISPETEALVRGFFSMESLGRQELKGTSVPIEVFRVHKESGVQDLFERSLYEGLTGLVGREAELGLIEARLDRVRAGEGRVVLLSGEAGVGKSRLVHQLRQQLAPGECTWRVCRGSPFHESSAFHPVIELVEKVLAFEPGDSASSKLGKLEDRVRELRLPLETVVPLLADFLGVSAGDRYPPLESSPQRRKEDAQRLLVDLVALQGRSRPLILVFEDLHWFDPSSLELVGRLIEGASEARALLLLTARPEFSPPWELTSDQTRIVVERLSAADVEAMVRDLAGGKPLPKVIVKNIVDKTDGVPLFVEELTKMVLESDLLREVDGRYRLAGTPDGGSSISLTQPLAIPSSLKDSLMARFDKVGAGKRTAQIASVLGREFTFELLREVVGDEGDLEGELARLVEGEFLFQRGVPPQATFIFKHALVQEATYSSLLKNDRRETHGRVARTLEKRFPEVAETTPQVLAHHFEHGGEPEPAVRYWKSAGELSAKSWAHVEASASFGRALELLDCVPASAERRQRELELRLALGVGHIVTKGYAAEEVRSTYVRALELSEELGDIPLPVRYGIWAVHLMRGDLEVTTGLARWFKEYAEQPGDRISQMMANACVATWFFYRGQHEQTLNYLESTTDLWRADEHSTAAQVYGGCGGFYGHLFTSATLWFLGYPDRAVHQFGEVERIVAGLSAPYTSTMSLFTGQMLHHLRRDVEGVRQATERLVAEATELEFPFLVAMGECGLGWAEARLGDPGAGIARSAQGLATLKATGTTVLYPYCASFQIESLLDADRREEGLALAAEAIEISRGSLDSFFLPELLRLEGELLSGGPEGTTVSSGKSASANRLEEALELSRRRGAKSLELRASLSLGRQLVAQGAHDRAAALVAAVRDRFDEGFDTADLETAASFLAERPGVGG